jgi:hypothetical protein
VMGCARGRTPAAERDRERPKTGDPRSWPRPASQAQPRRRGAGG